MEKFGEALGAIGGLAAVGGFIDFMLSRREQEKLRDWMTDWWVRLEDVKFSNFGRKEAREATKIIDKWAGARLFSVKRWCAVAIISLFCLALAATGLWLLPLETTSEETRKLLEQPAAHRSIVHYSVLILLSMPVALGISLSLMRLLAQTVARFAPNGLAGFLCFVAFLLLQWALLLYWTTLAVSFFIFVPLFVEVVLQLLMSGVDFLDAKDQLIAVLGPIAMNISLEPASRLHAIFPLQLEGIVIFDLAIHFKGIVDLVANGLRIGFALIFLSSFLFGSVLKPIISRLWARIIESKTPFFTLLFGGIGVVRAGLSALLS